LEYEIEVMLMPGRAKSSPYFFKKPLDKHVWGYNVHRIFLAGRDERMMDMYEGFEMRIVQYEENIYVVASIEDFDYPGESVW